MFRRPTLLTGLLFLASCDPASPQLPTGDPCAVDEDCVPNACCGKGDGIVNKSHAPDCTAVKCDGTCPPAGIKCGCAIPVCRSSHCTSAIATTQGC